jgi:hypothetical protein
MSYNRNLNFGGFGGGFGFLGNVTKDNDKPKKVLDNRPGIHGMCPEV